MARWVSSKVNAPITDMVTQMADGLVLVALVNCINVECGVSPYVLSPVHPKPAFRLHRLENVADVLQFCRLELKINTAAFSAENVVDGDTKLVLGLVWTLFVFATARAMLAANDSTSVAEIKEILLAWLNRVGRRRALPHIANFNADWSFQRLRRPDLVFACILDSYVPGAIEYEKLHDGKLLANMAQLCALAEAQYDIPPLAAPEDFNVLVPDEKCVLFYVLQWYLTFEKLALHPSDLLQTLATLSLDTPSHEMIAQFLALVLRAIKIRNKYDTLALRLVNHISHAKASLSRLEVRVAELGTARLSAHLDHYCAAADFSHQPAPDNSEDLFSAVAALRSNLTEYDRLRREIMPALFYRDFPELQALLKSIQVLLKQCGIVAGYSPSKQLSLPSIRDRLALLQQLDHQIAADLTNYVDELRGSKLRSLGQLVDLLHDKVNVASSPSPSLRAFVDSIDVLLQFKGVLDIFFDKLRQNHTTADLRVIILSLETLDIPNTPMTPEQSGFGLFCDLVEGEKNTKNLTASDVRDFIKRALGPASSLFDTSLLLRIIPSRQLLPRSESDNLIFYASDDSEDQNAVFETMKKNLEQKLSGNVLYDLGTFITKLDNGFVV